MIVIKEVAVAAIKLVAEGKVFATGKVSNRFWPTDSGQTKQSYSSAIFRTGGREAQIRRNIDYLHARSQNSKC